MVQLDTEDVVASSTPDYVIEYAYIHISTPAEDFDDPRFTANDEDMTGESMFPQISYDTFSSPALLYVFTAHDDSDFYSYVRERLERWTWMELQKLDREYLPTRLQGTGRRTRIILHPSVIELPADFKVPDTWDYADDQIPIWYREWAGIVEVEGPLL